MSLVKVWLDKRPDAAVQWVTGAWMCDVVWQIMATEKEKTACEAEHQLKAAEYTAIQERLAYLLHDIPRTVNRAKYRLHY